jgi:hypothetical protein
MNDWYAEVTPEERDRVIETVAYGVMKRGLETPAILFLEMHKPVSFFASQGIIVSSPFIAPFIGLDNLRIASRLLEKRENVELLIRRIEELVIEKQERQRLERQNKKKALSDITPSTGNGA